MLTVSRASEIAIGIACAAAIVAGTDFGQARRQLMQEMSAIVAILSQQLMALFQTAEALIGFRGGEASPGKRGWGPLVHEQKRE